MRQNSGVPGWRDFEIFRAGKYEKFPPKGAPKIQIFKLDTCNGGPQILNFPI